MSAEYLDLVDENNNPTGEKELRKEVHSFGLWHRTVHVYYFMKKNGKYYFLVHLRSKEKDLCPNTWDTRFGGHLKSGTTIRETVVSELEEEIGIKEEFNSFIAGPIRKRNKYPNNEFTYTFYYDGGEDLGKIKFNDNEVQEVKWLSATEIMNQIKNNPENWSTGLNGFEDIYNYLVELKNI